MIFFYKVLINFIFILSPLIILTRLFKNKEDLKRFKEKLGFFKKYEIKKKLIWFHGASVGELQSIVPLLEKLEKSKKVDKILITSNTLSSSKIISKIKLKKVIHQFFPIDTDFLVKKFISHWKPSLALFIDSDLIDDNEMFSFFSPLPSVRLLQATFNPKILVFGILNPKPSSAESLQKAPDFRGLFLLILDHHPSSKYRLVKAGHTMKRKGDPLPYLKTAGLTLRETSHPGSVPSSD